MLRQVPAYGARVGWEPSTQDDFHNGGAYPEISVLQYPLGLGLKSASQSKALQLQTDAKGRPVYEAILTQFSNRSVTYARNEDYRPHFADPADLQKPSEEIQAQTAEETALALLQAAKVKGSTRQLDRAIESAKKEDQFIRYVPDPAAPGYNEKCAERIIRLVEKKVDPLEPSKFRVRRAPTSRNSPPPPILRAPPKKLTPEDRANWNIPPCVSNWKNQRGYTIPLDMRIQVDGRGQQEVSINAKFGAFAEALYTAERAAREETRLRNDLLRQRKQEEEKQREEALREIAAKAREERAQVLGQAAQHIKVDHSPKEEERPSPEQSRRHRESRGVMESESDSARRGRRRRDSPKQEQRSTRESREPSPRGGARDRYRSHRSDSPPSRRQESRESPRRDRWNEDRRPTDRRDRPPTSDKLVGRERDASPRRGEQFGSRSQRQMSPRERDTSVDRRSRDASPRREEQFGSRSQRQMSPRWKRQASPKRYRRRSPSPERPPSRNRQMSPQRERYTNPTRAKAVSPRRRRGFSPTSSQASSPRRGQRRRDRSPSLPDRDSVPHNDHPRRRNRQSSTSLSPRNRRPPLPTPSRTSPSPRKRRRDSSDSDAAKNPSPRRRPRVRESLSPERSKRYSPQPRTRGQEGRERWSSAGKQLSKPIEADEEPRRPPRKDSSSESDEDQRSYRQAEANKVSSRREHSRSRSGSPHRRRRRSSPSYSPKSRPLRHISPRDEDHTRDRSSTQGERDRMRKKASHTERREERKGRRRHSSSESEHEPDIKRSRTADKNDREESKVPPQPTLASKVQQIEYERRREIERELRLERAGRKGRKFRIEGDRDVSERIALGQAQATSQEALYDTRLFNREAGGPDITQAGDDEYALYDRPLFGGERISGARGIYQLDRERIRRNVGRGQVAEIGDTLDEGRERGPVQFEK